jgi:hypothetical protein
MRLFEVKGEHVHVIHHGAVAVFAEVAQVCV